MINNQRFTLKNSNIVAEVFGDEVVIVNLDSGIYYSLRNTAAQIWIRLQNQYSPDEILNDLNIMYSQNENGIQKDLENFITRLRTEELITETAENNHQPLPAPVPNGKPVFKTPVIPDKKRKQTEELEQGDLKKTKTTQSGNRYTLF